jgi:carboxyl-terminal processing protease
MGIKFCLQQLRKEVINRVSALMVLFFAFSFVPSQAQIFNEEGLKFMRLFDWIKTRYVDTLSLEKFSDDIIRESLHKLDPHSVYLTRAEVAEMNEPLEGNFEGIGINFNLFKDTLFVISVIPDGPSEKAGMRAGDRIVKIEGENIAGVGITSKQITAKLKGKKGSTVNVSVKRSHEKELMPFSIVRDKIPIYSIDAVYKVDSSTGYIRLNRFSHTTISELTEALNNFKREKVSNLILDLSGNGGGYFDVAIAMVDEFLEADKLIVYTQGANSPKKEFFATSKGLFEKGKLIIIIDEGSASASEIVAGAIQDWDRGLIIGRRSFGKGLVQSQFIFPDESVIRLTIARYYTPTGRLIQKPYTDGYGEYSKEVNNRYKHGEFLNKDSIHFKDTSSFYTLTRKRRVFGGGGIMPDIFVPLDTSKYSGTYRNFFSSGIIRNFSLNFVDENRNELKSKYPEFKKFKEGFTVNDDIIKDLKKYAEDRSLPFKPGDFEHSSKLLTTYIKASIARYLWNNSEFIEIINETDPCYSKAVEVINNWDKYWGLK